MGGIEVEVFLRSFLTPVLNGNVSTFNVHLIHVLIVLGQFNDCEFLD